jgi:hypothetical protein
MDGLKGAALRLEPRGEKRKGVGDVALGHGVGQQFERGGLEDKKHKEWDECRITAQNSMSQHGHSLNKMVKKADSGSGACQNPSLSLILANYINCKAASSNISPAQPGVVNMNT